VDLPSSHLVGVAQVQAGAPTLELLPNESASGIARTPVMIRYLSDPGSLQIPEILVGAVVSPIFRQFERRVHSRWRARRSEQFALRAPVPLMNDLPVIETALRNSLRTGFHPSSAALPDGIPIMDFKAMFPQFVAAMMSLDPDAAPDPASVSGGLVGTGDDFAMAFRGDLIASPLADAVNQALQPYRRLPVEEQTFVIDYGIGTWTFWVSRQVHVGIATLELQDFGGSSQGSGRIVLSIPVHVAIWWRDKPGLVDIPSRLDFTVQQVFVLALNGPDAALQAQGDVDVIYPSGQQTQIKISKPIGHDEFIDLKPIVAGYVGRFKGAVQNQSASDALSARRLQDFLFRLMNFEVKVTDKTPAEKLPVDVSAQLDYTRFHIDRSGIVLHGTLSLPDWPQPHVEFDLHREPEGPGVPQYNALNSWVQGGFMERFIWTFGKSWGATVTHTENVQFVSVDAPSIGFSPAFACLMIEGTRVTATGPVVRQPVRTRIVCQGTKMADFASEGVHLPEGPHIPLVWQTPYTHDPRLENVASVSPWVSVGQPAANVLIHFPDRESSMHLEVLSDALEHSGRTDAVTTILCVFTPEQLQHVSPAPGLLYSDDATRWQGLFDVVQRPAFLLLSPQGKVVWRHNGPMNAANLAAVLEKNLQTGGQARRQFVETMAVRKGQRAPNFLFPLPDGNFLTLRKLSGRKLALLFFHPASEASRKTLAILRKASAGADGITLLVIGVEEIGAATYGSGVHGERLILAPDPDYQITKGYGVGIWPTTLFLDSGGIIEDIRHGLIQYADILPARETKEPAEKKG
jgi:hypothetical protein